MSVLTERTAPVPIDLGIDEVYRLSVKQFHAMNSKGILRSDGGIELLEGILVKKTIKEPRHCCVRGLLHDSLSKLVSGNNHLRTQEPITTKDSELEPDLAIVRYAPTHYVCHHPTSNDVAVVVEVSGISLAMDRGWKKRVYARAKIPFFWLVDIKKGVVEVFSSPGEDNGVPNYRERLVYQTPDSIPVVLDGREVGRISVKEILP